MNNKICFGTTLVGLLGAITLATAQAGIWSSPIKIPKSGDQGFIFTTGMDNAGNITAVGDNSGVYNPLTQTVASTALVGKAFSTPVAIAPPIISSYNHSPITLLSTPTGLTSLIYSDPTGFFPTSVERPPGGAWKLPVPVTSQYFPYNFAVSNDNGNEALVVDSGNVVGDGISAITRSAGGQWGGVRFFSTGTPTKALASVMASDGTLVFAYDTYTYHYISRYNHYSDNYVLHVATLSPGSSVWTDSGPLLGPDNQSWHAAKLAVDGAGRIGLLANSGADLVSIVKQQGAWGAAATVMPLSSLGGVNFTYFPGNVPGAYGSDALGNATFISINAVSNGAITINGNLATNAWGAIKQVANVDPAGAIGFATNSKGAAVIGWETPGPTVRRVYAITRDSTAQPWSKPTAIGSESAANAVPGLFSIATPMINANGQIAVYYFYYTGELSPYPPNGIIQVENNYVARYKP